MGGIHPWRAGAPTGDSARDIKRAVTGSANADKVQVQKMVKLQLSMCELPRPLHAADALAAAITYAARLPFERATGGLR